MRNREIFLEKAWDVTAEQLKEAHDVLVAVYKKSGDLSKPSVIPLVRAYLIKVGRVEEN